MQFTSVDQFINIYFVLKKMYFDFNFKEHRQNMLFFFFQNECLISPFTCQFRFQFWISMCLVKNVAKLKNKLFQNLIAGVSQNILLQVLEDVGKDDDVIMC